MIKIILFIALLAGLYFAGKRALSAPSGMGKGEAAARRELMELRGDAVEVDI